MPPPGQRPISRPDPLLPVHEPDVRVVPDPARRLIILLGNGDLHLPLEPLDGLGISLQRDRSVWSGLALRGDWRSGRSPPVQP